MKRTFVVDYEEDQEGYLYPAVILSLEGEDRNWKSFLMYVDSGADTTLLTKDDANLLGIDLYRGIKIPVGGILKGTIDGYEHNLKIRIADQEFRSSVIFADSNETPRLLGRKDIFEKFRVCFDEKKHKIYFIL